MTTKLKTLADLEDKETNKGYTDSFVYVDDVRSAAKAEGFECSAIEIMRGEPIFKLGSMVPASYLGTRYKIEIISLEDDDLR